VVTEELLPSKRLSICSRANSTSQKSIRIMLPTQSDKDPKFSIHTVWAIT